MLSSVVNPPGRLRMNVWIRSRSSWLNASASSDLTLASASSMARASDPSALILSWNAFLSSGARMIGMLQWSRPSLMAFQSSKMHQLHPESAPQSQPTNAPAGQPTTSAEHGVHA